jgi:hypothetical protein
MLRLSRLLALLAAIMLVIGGSPAVAASQPCNPCPPDCAMMKAMAATAADAHGQSPDRGSPAENPCKHGAICQAAAAAVAEPSVTLVAMVLTARGVDHRRTAALAVPSRPPDPGLRPPIQL